MPRLGLIGDSFSGTKNLPIMSEDITHDEMNSDTSNATLRSVWDCPQINKALVPGPDGAHVPGWICGWCPAGRGSFKGENATKALAHVAKIQRKNIRFCEGNIPQQKLIQYRNLWMIKSAAKSERTIRVNPMTDSIGDMQSRALLAVGGTERITFGDRMDDDDDVMLMGPPQKRPFFPSTPIAQDSFTGSTISSASASTAAANFVSKPAGAGRASMQMKLCGNVVDPDAAEKMNIAIADFIHSNCLPFSLADDPKFVKLIEVAKSLGKYKPPTRQLIGSKYLDALHKINWDEQMKTLRSEATIFGVTIFGDGATIKTVPLLNVLGAGVNNPFALLDIADCTDHMALGGMKDATHIANCIKPLIEQLEQEMDGKSKCTGVVDLVFFDGASNVQNAGKLLSIKYPRITVGTVLNMLSLCSSVTCLKRYA